MTLSGVLIWGAWDGFADWTVLSDSLGVLGSF